MSRGGRAQSALAWLKEAEQDSYPSTKAERDRRYVVEMGVNREVQRLGQMISEQALTHAATVRERRAVANELLQLLNEKANLAADGTLTAAEIKHYDELVRDVDRLLPLLESDAARSDWHLERCNNPLDAWEEMQHKYPALMSSF